MCCWLSSTSGKTLVTGMHPQPHLLRWAAGRPDFPHDRGRKQTSRKSFRRSYTLLFRGLHRSLGAPHGESRAQSLHTQGQTAGSRDTWSWSLPASPRSCFWRARDSSGSGGPQSRTCSADRRSRRDLALPGPPAMQTDATSPKAPARRAARPGGRLPRRMSTLNSAHMSSHGVDHRYCPHAGVSMARTGRDRPNDVWSLPNSRKDGKASRRRDPLRFSRQSAEVEESTSEGVKLPEPRGAARSRPLHVSGA